MNILDIGHDEGYNFTTDELKQLETVLKIIYNRDKNSTYIASNQIISLAGILSHMESIYLPKDMGGEKHMSEFWDSVIREEVEQAVAVATKEKEEEIAKKDAEIAELRSQLIRAGLMAP